jgi:Ca2+-binding EF-hand superfamily protein
MTGRRARELFDALDDDGNGVLTEEEFVQVQL